jgi:DNA-binding transcriptional ArsR family regulator
MVDAQLDALSVETRREIYRLLVERPRAVGELADALPVSRPAVSQHLRVLVDARLAASETVGTRHVYSADPEGMRRLRDWVDGMWEQALRSFARFVSDEMEDGWQT